MTIALSINSAEAFTNFIKAHNEDFYNQLEGYDGCCFLFEYLDCMGSSEPALNLSDLFYTYSIKTIYEVRSEFMQSSDFADILNKFDETDESFHDRFLRASLTTKL